MLQHLETILDAALAKVSTHSAVQRNLPPKPQGRCIVIGAGKASAAMAAAVEEAWPDVPLTGVVATRHGHSVPTKHVRIVEAGHPVPDEASVYAAEEMLRALEDLTSDDLVLALISGGGSATLALPVDGLSLDGKQRITKMLLRAGAKISEINTVRQALSRIKGGRLAAATRPARLVSLIISDVPGDDLGLVASGPTIVPRPSAESATDILERYKIPIAPELHGQLDAARTPAQVGNPRSENIMIASNSEALRAAALAARDLGYAPLVLGDAIECESSELGKLLAAMVYSARSMHAPSPPPLAIISGGETTVTLNGSGTHGEGGRNQEVMLSFAAHVRQPENVWAFAVDTDGVDGFVDAAGARFTPDTLARSSALGLDPAKFLAQHDSFGFFDALGDLVRTGPTLTNVNDLRVVLVGPLRS